MSLAEELHIKFDTLIQLLPQNWEDMAIQTKAFTRTRQIKSPKDLIRTVFRYAVADYSLREVAGLLVGEHKSLSDQAVHSRLSKCVLFLETLLSQTLMDKNALAAVGTRRRLKIIDGTVLNCPAATGTDYKMHLCYDAIKQSSCGVKLTDVKGAERFTQFEYEPLDLVLGDRIYGKAKHITKVKAQAADVVVRISFQQIKLYTEAGELIAWKEALIKAKDEGSLSLEAYLQDEDGKQTKVFVHGERLSESGIEKARRKIKKMAYDKGHQTREVTLLLCEWIIVLTTIAPDEVSAEQILELYRIRWQIELYIKRLKSLMKVGKIRAKRGSPLAKVHILAKMLFAVLIERIAQRRLGSNWTRMTGERKATWHRVWHLMADEFREAIVNTVRWDEWQWRELLRAISERRRKRKLQRVSKEVIRWMRESSTGEVKKLSNQPHILHLAA